MANAHQPELPALMKDLGFALIRVLQDDFEPIKALARAVKIDFPDGDPVVSHAASRPADGDWVMVPREPTYQMCEAGGFKWESPWHGGFPAIWKMMIDAAPKPTASAPTSAQAGDGVLDRPARVGGRDFKAGESVQRVVGRAHAEYDRHHGCLRHPHTGELRDYRDVESDPDGTLCVGPGPLAAHTPDAAARASDGPLVALRDKWATRTGTLTYDLAAVELDTAIERALTQPSEISGDQVVLVGYKNAAGEDCSAFLTASRIGQLLELTTPSDAGGEPASWQYRVTAGPQTGWSLWMDGRGDHFKDHGYTVEHRRVPAQTIFVIERQDGSPFYREDAMGILATDSEAQAIRFQHAREDEGADVVRYERATPTNQVDARLLSSELPSVASFASAVWCDWMTNEQADKLGAELHAWLSAHIASTNNKLQDEVCGVNRDALLKLVARWREMIDPDPSDPYDDGRDSMLRECRNELLSLLDGKGVGA